MSSVNIQSGAPHLSLRPGHPTVIPITVNGASILPAVQATKLAVLLGSSVFTPHIQFFRKFCQFHLQSMYGIHPLPLSPTATPWSCPDSPCLRLDHCSSVLTISLLLHSPPNSPSHKKSEGACEHLSQIKSLPPCSEPSFGATCQSQGKEERLLESSLPWCSPAQLLK